MKRVALIIIIVALLTGCAKEVSEVIEKYDNGNWKKVIVYKVSGENRQRIKAVEYYEDGKIKQEIDLRKIKDYTLTSAEKPPAEPQPDLEAPQQEIEYQGPYADMMNQPGAVTRKLEGEEKERVLEAMRKKKEEQQEGDYFTETDENGNEITKMRKILDSYEDGAVMHEQIFVQINGSLELETDSEYYANGQLRTRVPYQYGKANGKWYNYYRNGKLKTAGSSKDGNHHGPYTQYYENGQPMMVGQFKAGKMDGLWKYYWENGKPKMETTFNEDVEVGPLQRYDEEGNPIKHESPFRVGENYNFGDK
ncbi:MAG: toxin-antitoxin system YwqK family antitoxin [Candidatus Cloacimonetes bacterium]|nr:toxin-antitoxin system YwqK family antitoxin [Candidatus Cloacimonadota bacterium]